MKKYLFLALGVAALASCSSDEVVELNEGNEIKFSVVADNDSRAATVYCNNNKMMDFTLYASANESETFINGDPYNEENGIWSNTQGNDRYWPESASLDFYAVVNGKATVPASWGNSATPTVNFTTEDKVKDQLDFMYAVADNKTKASHGSAAVNLNFRHALSQIEFQAKNDNPSLKVEIFGVKVGKYYKSGVYTLPYANTEINFDDHTQLTTHAHAVGTWDITESEIFDYKVESETALATVNNSETKGITLSHAANDESADYAKSMLLLPSEVVNETPVATTAWTPGKGETDYDGTYLAVKCKIYNVVDVQSGAVSETALLHDGWAVIPASFAWEQGKKYIYTFNFTDGGNGGYEDKPGEPEPVLVPITLSVSVDDFQKGDNFTNTMETQTSEAGE